MEFITTINNITDANIDTLVSTVYEKLDVIVAATTQYCTKSEKKSLDINQQMS